MALLDANRNRVRVNDCLLGLTLWLRLLLLDCPRSRLFCVQRWGCLVLFESEPKTEGDRHQSYRGGNRHRGIEASAASDLNVRRNLKRLRLMTQNAERFFKLPNVRIDLSGTIPKVVVIHNCSLLFRSTARYGRRF